MPSCYVFGCITGSDCELTKRQRRDKAVPKLKYLPRDPDLRAKWVRKIERKDKIICEENAHTVVVCLLHFAPDDIIQKKKKNGGFKTDIKSDAVPCIFPNQPSYKTKITKRRKPPKERTNIETPNKLAKKAENVEKEGSEAGTSVQEMNKSIGKNIMNLKHTRGLVGKKSSENTLELGYGQTTLIVSNNTEKHLLEPIEIENDSTEAVVNDYSSEVVNHVYGNNKPSNNYNTNNASTASEFIHDCTVEISLNEEINNEEINNEEINNEELINVNMILDDLMNDNSANEVHHTASELIHDCTVEISLNEEINNEELINVNMITDELMNDNSAAEVHHEDEEISVEVPEVITDPSTSQVTFTLQDVKAGFDSLQLPGTDWGKHINGHDKSEIIHFSRMNKEGYIDRSLTLNSLTENGPVKATFKVHNKEVPISSHNVPQEIKSLEQISEIIKDINNFKVCSGISCHSTNFSQKCTLLIADNKIVCEKCKNQRKVQRRKEMHEGNTTIDKSDKSHRRLQQQVYRLQQQLRQHKNTINYLKEQCKKIREESLEKNPDFQLLTERQQNMVKNLISNAKKKSPCGNRYDNNWIYECILMRIKSPALYDSLRRKNLLPLPSRETLRLAMKKLRPSYGFQESTFHLLKEKAAHLSEMETHGVLLFDEMKCSEGLKFNKETLKVDGFVDLGAHTPENQKNTRGDHGLVVMFQPFTGQWVQVVGVFLASGCANGDTLTKIALEATLLMEASGFHVDGLVTDGASWNRTMWKNFGLSGNNGKDTKCYAKHPVDENRKLFFFSDFPHLLKCMRNNLQNREEFLTPDGLVQLKHWDYLVQQDEFAGNHNGLKRCPGLKNWMVRASNTQKMNVLAPFRVFSGSAAAAMNLGREEQVPELEDSEPTSIFCSRINQMADAMNNSSKFTALFPGSPSEKVITDFRDYLHEWQELTHRERANNNNEKKKDKFLSETTAYGFFVTLNATLQLAQYLCTSCDFEYLLTRKLNQDSLEHFFGLVRSSGGCSSHPNPTQFAQLVRLLSLYSLIKPPRGSNVPGANMVDSLLQVDDSVSENFIMKRKGQLAEKLDSILNQENLEYIPDLFEEHDYNQMEIDKMALGYLSGYVAKKSKRWCKDCDHCHESLVSKTESEFTRLIELKTRGFLVYPSNELVQLLRIVEMAIQGASNKHQLSADFLFNIVDAVEKQGIARESYVGCMQHRDFLTKDVLHYYLMCRMYFITNDACKRNTKQQQLSKSARLT